MVTKLWTWWERLLHRIDDWAEKRQKPWNALILEEDKADLLEIRRARRAIINHQYLLYTAECRIRARREWVKTLEDLRTEIQAGVKPRSTLEVIRNSGMYQTFE